MPVHASMSLVLEAMFSTSTQKKFWMFDTVQEVERRRCDANRRFRDDTVANADVSDSVRFCLPFCFVFFSVIASLIFFHFNFLKKIVKFWCLMK